MPISIVQSHRDGETVARTHVHSVKIFECVFFRLDLETEKRGERADVRNRDSWEGAKDKVKLEMDFKPQGQSDLC